MRVLPPASCWKYAGGRIINLHHGLLPSFPGMRPYHEAFASRMLTYGATCHFIVPELDAGNQIIHQSTFTVPPGMPLDDIIRLGQEDNEPNCLVEGVRRVVDGKCDCTFTASWPRNSRRVDASAGDLLATRPLHAAQLIEAPADFAPRQQQVGRAADADLDEQQHQGG